MLVEFRFENFRSFADEQALNLVATPDTTFLERNTFAAPGLDSLRLLRSTVIAGANAAGKSNVVKAAWFVQDLLLGSFREGQAGDKIPAKSFYLDDHIRHQPSRFELTFLLDGVRHQYGFAVTPERIHEEWLLVYPRGRPQQWFRRVTDDQTQLPKWSFGPSLKGENKRLTKMTRDDTLFLSVATKFAHKQLEPVFTWLTEQLRFANMRTTSDAFTAQRIKEEPSFHKRILTLLRHADLGIADMKAERRPFAESDFSPDFPGKLKSALLKTGHVIDVQFAHRGVDDDPVYFPLEEESDGTQRYFHLIGPWLHSLDEGFTLFADEVHANLHPLLTRKLLELFQNPKINKHNAQLIFVTHDTTLLDPELLRRDQIWLTEKAPDGRSRLYPLTEYRPRKDEALQKGYLAGRYGGVPYLGQFGS